ncbi:MarR family winged helix-turn-helix transcriptional regulator [Beijerinckia sp. L45]|uniref:MarR family winged helix-turn-helix transcriptional regulator n=1 Tax=Beijerinckia sp. L45 TaxID=1641855 RepID=UPI00131D434E|nr:MarR family transcriptional regulator [Beijerinckia sp. L45]
MDKQYLLSEFDLGEDLTQETAQEQDGEKPRAPSDPLRLNSQLCFAVYSASHMIKKAYRPHLDELGVTYPQYLVMMALWAEDGLRVLDIGRRLHVDSGTLTPLLKRMERLGLVARRRCVDDEREVKISLTSSGRRLRDDALRMRQAIAGQLKLVDAHVTGLRSSLDAMAAALRVEGDLAAAEHDLRRQKRRGSTTWKSAAA